MFALTWRRDRVQGDTAVAMSPKKHIDCRFRGQFLAEMPAQLSKAHAEGNMGRDRESMKEASGKLSKFGVKG